MNAGKIQSLKERGFAVVATLVVMTLLALTVVGLVSLSAIQLRLSGPMLDQVRAKANARMALVQAIGQLQKTLGPDRRVSAPAEILGDDIAQPHWTGVWKSKPPTGDDWLTRDDLDGGLRDSRGGDKRNPAASTVAWLVSGEGAPAAGPTGATIELLGAEKSGNKPVQVQTIPVAGEAKKASGHFAWWTGDLGIRANVAVPDAHAGDAIQPDAPDQNAYARILASQRIDESVVAGAKEVPEASRPLLASDGTLAAGVKDRPWADSHYLDFTSSSAGVLVDVNHGGLKKDLTAYLESDGTIAAKGGQKGLSDEDLLAGNEPGGSDSGRYAKTGPRFGLLRKWARANIPFSGSEIPAVLPETVPGDKAESQKLALSNEVPVKMEGNRIPSLQPVLVEATNYTQISTYSIGPATFQLRTMLYPRVVLWNPYNVNLQTQRSVIVIQGNGRQEMWTESRGPGNTVMQQQWLNFEGGRSTSFNLFGDRANDPGYNDPYIGSYYFSIPATKFEPGECLVFSPAKAAEYDGLSAYRPGRYNLAANELSCKVSPDPSRTYYVSASDIDGGFNFVPISFWYSPTPAWSTGGRNGVENQGDD
ncbi:MAG: hypothetical protein JWO82_968, partial [Akkermansiaceae bacterium]|nr:hypothetical protein [Akkermansiaceae bacterium]